MSGGIPNIIHYCWFGGKQMPESMQRCIDSWRRFMPQCEIKAWNESNFDVRISAYTEEAYRLKAYAHLSDYARFYILYNYGGIYLDTDVELIAPLDKLLEEGPFMCFEHQPEPPISKYGLVNPGCGMAGPAGFPYFKKFLESYDKRHFAGWNGRNTGNIVVAATNLLNLADAKRMDDGRVVAEGVNIYPHEVLSPINCYTREINVTEKTLSIHHYCASWCSKPAKSVFDIILRRLQYIAVRMIVTIRRIVL